MLKVHICSNPKITSKYGPRFHPVKKSWGFHNGVDIISKSGGTSLFAIADGTLSTISTLTVKGGVITGKA